MTKSILLVCGLAILLAACSKSHPSPHLAGKWQLIGSSVMRGPITPFDNGTVVLELGSTGSYNYRLNGSLTESGVYYTSISTDGYRDTILTLMHDNIASKQSVNMVDGKMYLSALAFSEGYAAVYARVL